MLERIARDDSQPELQPKAINYLGLFGGDRSDTILSGLYTSSKNPEARKAVLNALMIAGDRAQLADIARKEPDPGLRRHAINQLGVAGGRAELGQIYKEASDVDTRRAVINGLFVAQFWVMTRSKTLHARAESPEPMLLVKASTDHCSSTAGLGSGLALRSIIR